METRIVKIIRITLIILTGFLGLTAVLGGIALLANLNAPPLELLQDSIFKDYTIPAIALIVMVGGSAWLAAVMLASKSRFGFLLSAAAALIIMFFEFVEVQVIGSDAGAALTLQIFYFGLGTLIMVIALAAWYLALAKVNK